MSRAERRVKRAKQLKERMKVREELSQTSDIERAAQELGVRNHIAKQHVEALQTVVRTYHDFTKFVEAMDGESLPLPTMDQVEIIEAAQEEITESLQDALTELPAAYATLIASALTLFRFSSDPTKYLHEHGSRIVVPELKVPEVGTVVKR